MTTVLAHSCCPMKRTIYAPSFERVETTIIPGKGTIELWRCTACKTEVMVTFDGATMRVAVPVPGGR